MNIGIMWWDDSKKKSLEAKIIEARDYHKKKYIRLPDTCIIHPSMLGENKIQELSTNTGLTVQIVKYVLPNSIWIGVDADTKDVNRE